MTPRAAHARPRVPRETRLLLAIVALSVATLWALARVRFPDRPATPNPVQPVLAQLRPVSPLAAITSAVTEAEPRIRALVAAVEADGATRAVVAHGELLVALLSPAPARVRAAGADLRLVARDRVSGLTLLARSAALPPAPPAGPVRLTPGFLIAASALDNTVVLRPVFVPVGEAAASPVWQTAALPLSSDADLDVGTFLFTFEGALAGVVAEARARRRVVVPAEALIAAAERLAATADVAPGALGIEAGPLTPRVRELVGSGSGVVVTWVDPAGPAAGQLRPTDVVERFDDAVIRDIEEWAARAGRLNAGQQVRLGVRRGGETVEVVLTAAFADGETETVRPLGATFRNLRGLGAQVVAVEPGSAAVRAGLQPGDVVTVFGDATAPTAAAIQQRFAAHAGGALLLAVTRGDTHLVAAMEKQW